MSKVSKINILLFIILLGLGISVGYHYYYGVIKGNSYPYNTFLFLPVARFSDYSDVIRDSQSLNPYLEYKSAQYPFLIILGYIFSLIAKNSYVSYLSLVITMVIFFTYIYLRGKKWYTNIGPVLIISLLNYPFLIVVDRGNFESLLFVILLLFLFFFSKKQYSISALILAFAISMKIYPAILLVLFIPEKRYRAIVTCIVSTVVITFASLLQFKGGVLLNLEFLLHGSNIASNSVFSQFTSINSSMVQRGVSLLTLIKIFNFETNFLPDIITNNFLAFYLVLTAILAMSVVIYLICLEKETWKRVALLIFSMLLLPTISADYKLLHIFIPLYLFINNEHQSKFDMVYLLMFGLLLIPKDYYYFASVYSDAGGSHDISIAVVINIFTMLLMSIHIMTDGIKSHFSNSRYSTQVVDDGLQ